MTDSVETNKKLVRNFIELTWNQGRFNLARSLLARDFTYYASMVNMPMGIEDMGALIGKIRDSMEDFSISVEEIVCEGNRVVTQSTFCGSLIKPLMGFQPVDKMVALHAATFWEIKNGQIVSGTSLLDTADLFQQVYRIMGAAHQASAV
ncbi:ester cyclase [Thalassolituus sp. LLYu03]|uniref:ester cyclase n=1 Tax=Thalassolituus sp. LLYu03 TaxID=3421656 RepID=UPI003D2CC2A6